MPTDSYSVKWSVYFDGKQKQFASGLVLQKKDVEFLKANKSDLSGRVKDDRLRNLWHQVYGVSYTDEITGQQKTGILHHGRTIISQIEKYFTFEIFSQAVAGKFIPEGKEATNSDILIALTKRGELLRSQGDVSNGNLHDSTVSSLKRYAVYANLAKNIEKVQLPIQIITPQFLRNYEKWMLKRGKAPQSSEGEEKPASITTVAFYIRNVRKIWNEAIEDGIVNISDYPFGKNGYKIPDVKNKKKALSKDVISALYNYQCKPGSPREKWRDMWFLIYFGNGINTMDLCTLKNSDYNVKENVISFFRDKTMETKRENMQKIEIVLNDDLIAIVQKWRSDNKRPSSFLFPFLPDDVSPEREKALVNQVTKNINEHMAKIVKELNLDIKVRTYEARHSFASALKEAEAPIGYISEKLGHNNTKTTERYLNSFEKAGKDKYLNALIPKARQEEVE